MRIYDDKTTGILKSNDQFVLTSFETCDGVTFKASYIVASDLNCTGKVTALFDLIVFGNVEAVELDVKGKFICTGKCVISGTLSAQYDIWVDYIHAKSIECRDRIVAQEIDADVVNADGDIVVGKCLAVMKLAHSGNNIVCGETAYGSGKVEANNVITGEPIDLDEGVDAVVNPYTYNSLMDATPILAANNASLTNVTPDFVANGDWAGYLDWLIKNSEVESVKDQFMSWKKILSTVYELTITGMTDCRDLSLLIWTVGIASSDYFSEWSRVQEILMTIDKHFASVVKVDRANVFCSLESYSELIQALDVLERYGDAIDMTVYGVVFEILLSNFGLKPKFLIKRLNEKGC